MFAMAAARYVEDVLQLRPHEEAVHDLAERPEGHLVGDLVIHAHSALHGGEAMLMHPGSVWSLQLDVTE